MHVVELVHVPVHNQKLSTHKFLSDFHYNQRTLPAVCALRLKEIPNSALKSPCKNKTLTPLLFARKSRNYAISAAHSPLDLTEDNIKQVLADARVELGQLFDDSVGITGKAELADLDGPYVKISLSGKFWHKRTTVLARLGNYLKQRIPEILEVDIEDEKQFDDSPANY